MLLVKFIWGVPSYIEDDLNKFLEQCNKKGYVVCNITYISRDNGHYHVFVEYETMDSTEEN